MSLNPNVFLVEKDELLGALIVARLSAEQYGVRWAKRPELPAPHEKFGAILVDAHDPVFIHQLRTQCPSAHIIATGSQALGSFGGDVNYFLPRPFSNDDILKLLRILPHDAMSSH